MGPQETEQIALYRNAVANDLPLLADSAKSRLETAGLSVKINDAGRVFVSNRSRADGGADAGDSESTLKEKVQQLIALRAAARKSRNFPEADRIRDELAAMGVVLKDSKGETTWEIAR